MVAASLALLFLLSPSFPASGPSSGADVIFVTNKIDPVAASPSRDLNFNVVAQNWGLTSVQNLTMAIVLPDDLVLKDSSMERQSVGPLCSFCNVETKYLMKVGEWVMSGDYTIKVVASWETGSRDREFTVSVSQGPAAPRDNERQVRP